MPKQKRWQIKRRMDQAVKEVELSQNNLIKAGAEFEGHSSGYYEHFCSIIAALQSIKETIQGLNKQI